MCLPLEQFTISGKCLEMDMTYQPKSGDEVEDLYSALLCVKVWRIEFGSVLEEVSGNRSCVFRSHSVQLPTRTRGKRVSLPLPLFLLAAIDSI